MSDNDSQNDTITDNILGKEENGSEKEENNTDSDDENNFEHAVQRFWLRQFVSKRVRSIRDAAKKTGATVGELRKTISKKGLNIKGRIASSDNLQLLNEKIELLNKKIKNMPFIRSKDIYAYVLGIFLLMTCEYFMLVYPENFYQLYTYLLFPLLITRFFLYHKAKYHYFMLDFCYYHQLITLFYLYVFNGNENFFILYFFLSNGPLAFAILMWENKLVFHDLDKTTSLFIHLSPPLLSFCLRWYPKEGQLFWGNIHGQSMPNLYVAFVVPLAYYIYWQFSYILKTEVIDRMKLDNDSDIMTSLRWLTRIKPHPVYVYTQKYYPNVSGLGLLLVSQAIYTAITLIGALFMYKYKLVHLVFLFFIFCFATWNGAKYYFDTFAENYERRIEKQWNKISTKTDDKKRVKKQPSFGYTPSSLQSFVSFLFFFIFVWLGGIVGMRKLLIA